MVKAIHTSYLPATNTKPRRIRVAAYSQRKIMSEDHTATDDLMAHWIALQAVVVEWWGEAMLEKYAWHPGGAMDGLGIVWVGVPKGGKA